MNLTIYTESLNPLDITRVRIDSGMAYEKLRFNIPLPGEATALEVFERRASGGAEGVTWHGDDLLESLSPALLPQPPLQLLLLIDSGITADGPLPEWLDDILQAPESLYLLLPRLATPRGAGNRSPAEIYGEYFGEIPKIRRRAALMRVDDRPTAFRLLLRPEFGNAALVADPSTEVVEQQHGKEPENPLSMIASGGAFPFDKFHQTLSQCRWLMSTYGRQPVAVSIYTSEARHRELRTVLAGYPHKEVHTIRALPKPADFEPPEPYEIEEIEPAGTTLPEAERLTLRTRGALDDLLGCHNLQHLVVDDSLWLDCASIARLESLCSLSMVNVKVQDLAFLQSLPHFDTLRISWPPFVGLEALGTLSNLRFLEIENIEVPSLAFVQKLVQLQSLYVYCLHNANKALRDLASHPSLHSLILPNLQIENLDLLSELRLRRFETWSSPVADIQSLTSQCLLRRLRLEDTQVCDLSPLAGLQQLEEIRLLGSPVQDLSPLAGCSAIRLLDCTYGTDIDWSILAQLSGLEVLNLGASDLADVKPLRSLQQLRVLDVSDTAIRSVEPLADLHNLEELFLDDTPVRDFSPLASLPKLRRLVIDEEQAEGAARANLEAEVR